MVLMMRVDSRPRVSRSTYLFDDTFWPYWEGFAYANTTDTTTLGVANQYSVITGMGVDGSSNYGVCYAEGFYGTMPTITFVDEVNLVEAYITNTTWAFLSMQDGDAAFKKIWWGHGR